MSGYDALDVSAVTAARLSARFTYVTPVSRAQCCPPRPHRYHIADGGYYDNYGLASISELLDQATRTSVPVHHILLVQILLDRPGNDPPSGGSRGWFFQSFAPLVTLANMRSAAQYSRDETEFALLQQTLAARGVKLDRAAFPYEIPNNPNAKRPTPPLSWHLTAAQIRDVQDTWNAYVSDNRAIASVISFVRNAENSALAPGPNEGHASQSIVGGACSFRHRKSHGIVSLAFPGYTSTLPRLRPGRISNCTIARRSCSSLESAGRLSRQSGKNSVCRLCFHCGLHISLLSAGWSWTAAADSVRYDCRQTPGGRSHRDCRR